MAREQVLPRDFYGRSPEIVARELLGCVLVRRNRQGTVRGRIVETEAYLAHGDSACHSARGQTPRNTTMFGPAGYLYVYSIHSRYCMNVVTETAGVASAVLIRAVEPMSGVPLMQLRRGRDALRDLTRGPARLCEAFDVTRALDGWDLTRGRTVWIERVDKLPPLKAIARSPRIGVTSAFDLPLRFFVPGNPYVSGRRFPQGETGT